MNPSVLDHLEKQELTIDATQANTKALLLSVPILVIILTPYLYLHLSSFSLHGIETWINTWAGLKGVARALGVMIGGIILHELIHGLTFAYYAQKGLRSIQFGIIWKSLTPYCHCSEPLKVSAYRVGTLMPAIILGVIPSVISMITGSPGWLLFGIFFTIAAGGDFIVVHLLKDEPRDNFVQDHPEKIGCYVFRPL